MRPVPARPASGDPLARSVRTGAGWLPLTGPARLLAYAVVVNTLGNGLSLGPLVLYLTRARGLDPVDIGIGFSIGGALALLVSVPVGQLADRRGPRGVYLVALVGQALTAAGYLLVDGYRSFLVVACLWAVARQCGLVGWNAAVGAVTADGQSQDQIRSRAWLRTLSQLGFVVGGALGGIGVQLGTLAAFQVMIVADAVSYLGCAVLVSRLPVYPPRPRPVGGRRWVALRDRPFTALTLTNAVLCLQLNIWATALPLWIADHTSAPRWTISATVAGTALLSVVSQVWVSGHIRDPRQAARATALAGVLFQVSCVGFGLATGVEPWVATVLLLVAACVHTAGELVHAGATMVLRYDLAAPYAVGQYQGVFQLGHGVAFAVAPAVLTVLCLEHGTAGWVALGAVLLLAGVSVPPIVGWAVRNRSTPSVGDCVPTAVPAG